MLKPTIVNTNGGTCSWNHLTCTINENDCRPTSCVRQSVFNSDRLDSLVTRLEFAEVIAPVPLNNFVPANSCMDMLCISLKLMLLLLYPVVFSLRACKVPSAVLLVPTVQLLGSIETTLSMEHNESTQYRLYLTLHVRDHCSTEHILIDPSPYKNETLDKTSSLEW
eukprot:1389584-Amphidinium_carterae.1